MRSLYDTEAEYEDEMRHLEYEFGTAELREQDRADRIARMGEPGPQEVGE